MPRRPNILWYCSDQQRFDTLGAWGNPHIHTPRLDRFAGEAVSLTRTYCQSPICTPSRASFLTGMYPSAVAVDGNGIPRFPACYAERLITRQLADAGYDCGNVGKLHLATAAGRQEPRVADGYRYFQYSHDPKGPRVYGHDYAEWLRTQGADADTLLAETVTRATYLEGASRRQFGGLFEPTAERDNIPPHLHQTHWCSEKSIEFLRKNRDPDRPWLLTVNPFDPHAPFDPPWEYYRRYRPESLPGAHFQPGDLALQHRLAEAGVDFQSRALPPEEFAHRKLQAAYYAMIELIDTEFGRLLDDLDAQGQREDTIVIFTSDHGEMLGDHGLTLKGCRFYEGLVRVPLLIRWPGRFREGLVSDALVELLDLAPTLYEAAGLGIPYWVQGRSLGPVLAGDARRHRDAVRCEFYGAIDYPDQTHATMYCDGRWKLVTYHGKEIDELYDLQADPWEHRDLSTAPAATEGKVRLLRQSFDATVRAIPPQEPRVGPY